MSWPHKLASNRLSSYMERWKEFKNSCSGMNPQKKSPPSTKHWSKMEKMCAQLLSLARHYGQFSELAVVCRLLLRVNVATLDFRHAFDANSSFVALLARPPRPVVFKLFYISCSFIKQDCQIYSQCTRWCSFTALKIRNEQTLTV